MIKFINKYHNKLATYSSNNRNYLGRVHNINATKYRTNTKETGIESFIAILSED